MTAAESESAAKHREAARAYPPVRVAVVTVSDTRTKADDASGAIIQDLLRAAGHEIARYEVIRDEPIQIRTELLGLAADASIQAIVFTGGTGVAQRDSTVEIVEPMLEKTLPGFGEIFRMLSWQEIGPPAILSRAVAGVFHGMAIFCLPGSRNAVRLATEKIIAPELAHLLWEIREH